MSTIALFPFQARASEQIAARFVELIGDKKRPMVHRELEVPFYQALGALTGAGKTPILADAIAQMRASVSPEPVVLWISKAKVVVEQCFNNFDVGGKYAHLLDGFVVQYLSQLSPERISDGTAPQLVLSTVGAFNQSDKSDGTLRVHKTQQDRSDEPLWTLLRNRRTTNGLRRPLFVVYDEGHNLSDQQTELLLELEPDAVLLASATLRIPQRLARLVSQLRDHKGDDFLLTQVPSKAVVKAGLVKERLCLGGYSTLMEEAVNDLLDAMQIATEKAKTRRAGFTPKAIYVCKTNVSQEDGTTDIHSRPFQERKAPPILIWRHLTEVKGIDPAEIAVYCDLKFDRGSHPPPKNFRLFSGGEDDFAAFTAGDFKHVIFNLGLQEGWDDPSCYFAYIDKSMGSAEQVQQVIGRVLRQPQATHFADVELNTASFYIRMDDKQEFKRVLDSVRKQIAADLPEIMLDSYVGSKGQQKTKREPKRGDASFPSVHIDAAEAHLNIMREVARLPDYRSDRQNTVGKGMRVQAVQRVGDDSLPETVSKEMAHSNRVVARWLMRRAVQGFYADVVKTIDWADKKFDARIELTSRAADQIKRDAKRLVDLFLDGSELALEAENPYVVGSIAVNPAKFHEFENAVHEGYSDLNAFELEVARAIDGLGLEWVRNPSSGGFSIPLLQHEEPHRFFPDFLVWKGNRVFAIDPKGDHLVREAATSKLFEIRGDGNEALLVRLLTEGRWATNPPRREGPGGYSVWSLRAGQVKASHCPDVETAVKKAVS